MTQSVNSNADKNNVLGVVIQGRMCDIGVTEQTEKAKLSKANEIN